VGIARGDRVSAKAHFSGQNGTLTSSSGRFNDAPYAPSDKGFAASTRTAGLTPSYRWEVLAASVNKRSGIGREPDPLRVVQALMDAEHVTNLVQQWRCVSTRSS
jgi:hypothetical protein